jgi:hypothetical protein
MASRFYFDTKTGRRVSKETWKRSKVRGGTRYKRRNKRAEKFTRFTVGITFPYRKDYRSVLAQLYTSKPWKSAKKSTPLPYKGQILRTQKDKASTRKAAIRKVEELIRYPRTKFWFDLDGVTSTETITTKFDAKFAEKLVVIDEDNNTTKSYRRRKK